MFKWMFALFQFFPLSIFASFAFFNGMPSNQRWLEAFQLGAMLGVIQLIILLPLSKPLNRLILAGNLYLILGGLAVFYKQWWLLNVYDALRESAILIFMVCVGLISIFSSSAGFIAVKHSERRFSWWLLFAVIAMLPFAVYFQGQRLYSAILPIIFLAVVQRYLVFIAHGKCISSQ